MHRVMVVDDEAVISMQLEERLEAMGYDVVGTASSGEEAVDMAIDLRPDIILMDIVMPGKLDGIQASEMIKAELDIPVIFLTAYTDEKFIDKAKDVEPFGYIVKPFQEKEIRACIEIAIFKSRIERRLRESEERYRSMVDSASKAIIAINSSGKIIYWNHASEVMFGYSAGEAAGKPLTLLVPEQLGKELENDINRTVSRGESNFIGKTLSTYGIGKNGRQFPLEFSIDSWNIKEDIFFTVIVSDISKRIVAEDGREKLVAQPEEAEANIKILSGIIPICAYCKKIRDDMGCWYEVEKFIRSHSNVKFTHGICPKCAEKLYNEFDEAMEGKE